ncbi:hypothetical protein KTH40_10330 [Acinetobacter haemolyticus]|uniref:hypothetical protein n=1 Tax=Acinetobacter haemolyticus TaxID=29430 RepID=UPI0021D21B45|nr:hypothetical protein [Acinetobacter haemolyticus]MCU4387999.1 hypothetical protein [Acinetobacter haemolyticus]
MATVNMRHEIGATFQMRVSKKDGKIVSETPEFHNLVLDSGLERMGVGTWLQNCRVGSGSSEPIPTQQRLDNTIATTTNILSSSNVTNTTTKPYYKATRHTFRFSEGAAAGNLTEVGLGWTQSGDVPCWSRALIKDSNGNPTTLTILSDEILDVIVTVRVYPSEYISGNFNFKDKFGNVLSEHAYSGYLYLPSTSNTAAISTFQIAELRIYTGASYLETPTSDIQGTILVTKTAMNRNLITPTLKQHNIVLGLTEGNGSCDGFRVLTDGIYSNSSASASRHGYKATIDPPIVKTNAMEITWRVNLTWGRYVT